MTEGPDQTVVPDPGEEKGSTGHVYSARQLARARELLTRLYAVRRTARFYPMEHPATRDGIRALTDSIVRFHEEGLDVELAFFEGELLFGDTLLVQESILFDQLIREMTSIGAGSLSFLPGMTPVELERAISVLIADPLEIERSGGLQPLLAKVNVHNVQVGEVKVFEKLEDIEDVEAAGPEAYNGAINLVREIDSLIRHNKTVSSTQVKGVVRDLVGNVLSSRSAMLELTGLRSYDEYTFYHSANVAILSLALASAITDEYRFLSSIGAGALLHDIGKMTVGQDVVNKPGSLTPEEWELMRWHPVFGAEQAALMPGLDKSSIVIILEHHMGYDGSGYPRRATGGRQHLASRIVAVADAYDAMTSQRSYSAARTQDDAMSLLVKGAGTSHDPALTRLFVNVMGVYPPRTPVRLSDGRTGVVLRPSDTDPVKPLVRLFADETGRIVDPEVVDLSAQGLEIARALDASDLNIDVGDYV